MSVQGWSPRAVQENVDDARKMLRAVRPHAVPLVIMAAFIAFLYYSTARWLVNAWLTDAYYTHGFLVPPVALFFAWRVRAKLRAEPAVRAKLTNAWAAGLAAALYIWGIRATDPFILSISLIVLLFGIALYLQGFARTRHLIFPLALLLLAVPLPNLLTVGLVLQQIAATGTSRFLAFFGLDVVQDNFTITAGTLSFQVIPMCSGLSSSISILTLSSVVAAMFPLRWWGRAIVVAACVPIALIANILRISLTIWVGLHWGPEASEGFLHGASSLVLFLIAFGSVLGLAFLLEKLTVRREGA